MSKNYNPYSHCACCDKVLSGMQPMVKASGQVDDLCAECRQSVRKAVHYHEQDVKELEEDVWRAVQGYEEGLTGYKDADKAYTG